MGGSSVTGRLALEFGFQPKQKLIRAALYDAAGPTNLGIGGSRGGGKSHGCRDLVLMRRLEFPGTNGWIFRKTVDEVRKNHIEPMFREHPGLVKFWNDEKKTLYLPVEGKTSTVEFVSADNFNDVLKKRGQQAMDILLDEANLIEDTWIDEFSQCNRQKGVADGLCKMMELCNPGGVGHRRIRRHYVDRIYEENEDARDYLFIPFFAWDNVTWSESRLREDAVSVREYYGWPDERRLKYFLGTAYGKKLNALPEPDRSMQLYGRFDVSEGHVFQTLMDSVHNLDDYFPTDEEWVEWTSQLRTAGALDHGSTGTKAYVMTGTDVFGNRFALEEVYKKNTRVHEMVEGVLSLKKRYPAVEYDLIDPSTENDTQENKEELFSVQKLYRDEGLGTIVAARTKISVGIELLNNRLRVDPFRKHPFHGRAGSPSWFISRSRCPNLWAEMTDYQLVYKNGKAFYIGSDHAIDDIRYVEVTKPPAAVPRPNLAGLSPMDFAMRAKMAGFRKEWDRASGVTVGNTAW